MNGRAVPQYFVLVGGGVSASGAEFGKLAGKVPARRTPEAVARLSALYLAERLPGEEAGPFFARAFEHAKAAIAPLEALGTDDARPDDFIEPGSRDEFRPETQAGECAA
jgi:sulfite reductase (NADPH) hemoprotein beta-component